MRKWLSAAILLIVGCNSAAGDTAIIGDPDGVVCADSYVSDTGKGVVRCVSRNRNQQLGFVNLDTLVVQYLRQGGVRIYGSESDGEKFEIKIENTHDLMCEDLLNITLKESHSSSLYCVKMQLKHNRKAN
ncbi:hypothetical protein T8K17_03530 [Thalassobaculum sp. OXR-137]|uniref:hypothetical protein n=1 Tax=Thalassobaculum sp. OXR-137 TaxID=3100173 RepID=UPI002AC99147|nr:hypothetical protein [Thalassobaculum sp. OXR-137]WPZ35218.1 hypothetical protein T8K17_03530 [Thalassobaculum sp. OXR-137]